MLATDHVGAAAAAQPTAQALRRPYTRAFSSLVWKRPLPFLAAVSMYLILISCTNRGALNEQMSQQGASRLQGGYVFKLDLLLMCRCAVPRCHIVISLAQTRATKVGPNSDRHTSHAHSQQRRPGMCNMLYCSHHPNMPATLFWYPG